MNIVQNLSFILLIIITILVILISVGVIKIHCDIYRKQIINIQ